MNLAVPRRLPGRVDLSPARAFPSGRVVRPPPHFHRMGCVGQSQFSKLFVFFLFLGPSQMQAILETCFLFLTQKPKLLSDSFQLLFFSLTLKHPPGKRVLFFFAASFPQFPPGITLDTI